MDIDQDNYNNAGGCDHTNFHYWKRCVCGKRTWYSTIDPSTHRPPGGPWVPVGDAGAPYPTDVGGAIWIARQNLYVQTNEKTWTITVTGDNADKYGISETHGYKNDAGPNQPATEVPVGAVTSVQDEAGPPKKRTFTCKFRPQPDWEIARIVRTTAGLQWVEETMETTSHSACTRIVTEGNSCTLTSTRFGVQGVDFHRLNEITMFPVQVPVDPAAPHMLDAPPHTGNWSWQVVYVDPVGHARPQGGVRWVTDGAGLTAEDLCNIQLFMIGDRDAADTEYDLYALDVNEPEVQYFRLVADVQGIPTVSEWGLAALAMLLLTAGALVLRRRRTAPTA